MNRTRPPLFPIIALAALATFLSGCALEPPRTDPEPPGAIAPVAPPSEVERLLAYAVQTRRLDPREFAAAREQARSAFQLDRSDASRARYALLLAMTPSTPQGTEDVELIALIDPLVNGADDGEMRGLALLMQGIVQDRRKLREQLRDSQSRLAAARREEPKEAELRILRARIEELEKKLEALKSIDRSVNRRSDGAN